MLSKFNQSVICEQILLHLCVNATLVDIFLHIFTECFCYFIQVQTVTLPKVFTVILMTFLEILSNIINILLLQMIMHF